MIFKADSNELLRFKTRFKFESLDLAKKVKSIWVENPKIPGIQPMYDAYEYTIHV